MLRARANGETFVSATMCRQQCVGNNVSATMCPRLPGPYLVVISLNTISKCGGSSINVMVKAMVISCLTQRKVRDSIPAVF